ncbi:peptidase U32 family protein [Thermovenabulum gondwanense]|uniref:Putative protease YdcP n=1 Tax=Thermovenabulum gondwanense TaxID=520767 RepID=A0A161PWV0_9FIRM|nr:U32 family peptidase [Thermovenabulum gondwanense]KYO65860.1 putative protease YdcP [Thermovenabulum gondwanense]
MKIPELLAPAGNLEKLKYAIYYGADAVYAGGKDFSLRAKADNFTLEELEEGIIFAHEKGKKVYVAINIFPHNEDIENLTSFIKNIAKMGADAFIISDPGVLMLVKELAPDIKIHLSTQANSTNWKSCLFWHNMGVNRIILARELSLREIKEIRERVPETLELEIFVHGSMCISYSGRCLLSNYLTFRDANRGECAHPCRYKYFLVEEKRPGQYFPIFEDERGTYILNSKDLCMLDKIPEILDVKIDSLKIEGRMKSLHYVAQITKLYREALDIAVKNPDGFVFKDVWKRELLKITHREYTHGFYFGKPDVNAQIYSTSSYINEYEFVGLVKDYDEKTKKAIIEQRNPVKLGDEVEILSPDRESYSFVINKMWDVEGNEILNAPHPKQIFQIEAEIPLKPYDILRKPAE